MVFGAMCKYKFAVPCVSPASSCGVLASPTFPSISRYLKCRTPLVFTRKNDAKSGAGHGFAGLPVLQRTVGTPGPEQWTGSSQPRSQDPEKEMSTPQDVSSNAAMARSMLGPCLAAGVEVKIRNPNDYVQVQGQTIGCQPQLGTLGTVFVT